MHGSRIPRLVSGCIAALLCMTMLVACSSVVEPLVESDHPGPPVEPEQPDLTTPESSVRSYLDWISYAYRIADSSVSEPVMTAWQDVRVDSYVELNRQEGRALEQYLLEFVAGDVSVEGTQAVLTAAETWRFRYFVTQTGLYDGEWVEASYDATYSLVFEEPDWLVDKVDATALTPLE